MSTPELQRCEALAELKAHEAAIAKSHAAILRIRYENKGLDAPAAPRTGFVGSMAWLLAAALLVILAAAYGNQPPSRAEAPPAATGVQATRTAW